MVWDKREKGKWERERKRERESARSWSRVSRGDERFANKGKERLCRRRTVAIMIPMNFAVLRSTNPSERRSWFPEVATHAPEEMDSASQVNWMDGEEKGNAKGRGG